MSRLHSNILEPLTFEEHEIGKFIQEYSCGMCRGHLVGSHAPGRKWTAHCHTCDAPIYEHNAVKKYTLDAINQDEKAIVIDNRRAPEDFDPAQALKDIGF